jgi:hypothetical protein
VNLVKAFEILESKLNGHHRDDHTHDYAEIAVQSREEREPIAFAVATTNTKTHTLVLHRCSLCGDKFTQELSGTWTLEQVRGEAHE